jgi:1,4-dihydroxy-2-naphthoate octaprenyltransferase
MARLSNWWQAARPFSFTVSVIPPLLGSLIAVMEHPSLSFNTVHFILVLFGCVLAHAGANMLSDYFDYRKRVDREGTFGSSGVLVGGLLSPSQILRGAIVAYAVAAAIGLYLIQSIPNGTGLVWLILVGAILGIFYTAGPIAFKYRALGDLAVFISFGSAMTLGAYYVQAHQFSWAPVLYALPLALLVDAVLHSNNLRDIENDKKVDIKTLPIIVGEEASKIIYYALIFGAYVLTAVLVVLTDMPVLTLVTLLSLPLAIKLAKLVSNKTNSDPNQFAMIDAATAQLHSAFGILLLVSLAVHHFIF